MNNKPIISVLLLLTLAFIWGNSLLPGEVSGALSDAVMDVMNKAAEAAGLGPGFFTFMADADGDGEEEPTSHLVRKMAHIIEFAVLGGLLTLRLIGVRHRWKMALAFGVLTAICDETLQLFSQRGSQITDVLIDSCGVLLGLGLLWFLQRKTNHA